MVLVRNNNRQDNERLAGMLTGTFAQIAADPYVHQFWPMHRSFVQGIGTSPQLFAARPAKYGSLDSILRPSELGYRPQWIAAENGGIKAGYLRFGFDINGGSVGGNLSDIHNGALETATDAMIFPQQDAANSPKIPYTLVAAARAFTASGGMYAGSIIGSMTAFPDTDATLSDWAGLGVGFGASSGDDPFFAGRGTTGKASHATGVRDDNWYVFTGIYDTTNSVYKLRKNGVQVTSTAWPAGVSSNPTLQRRGYQPMRMGASGDIGAPIERTWVGDIGPCAVMHVVGDDATHLASLTRIENALMTLFGI